jgi:hypothetical protein
MSSRRQRTWSGNIEQPTDLWDLEHYLTESRKRIDRTYDYRYSVLTDVFGSLIREGRLSEKELQGLGEDKLESIRSYAKILAKLEEVGLKPGGS